MILTAEGTGGGDKQAEGQSRRRSWPPRAPSRPRSWLLRPIGSLDAARSGDSAPRPTCRRQQAKAIEKTFAAIGWPAHPGDGLPIPADAVEMAWGRQQGMGGAQRFQRRTVGSPGCWAPGEDGVPFEPSPVEDQPKHAADGDDAEVAGWFSTDTDPSIARAVATAEAIARKPVEGSLGTPQVDSIEWSDEWFDLTENLCGTGSSAGGDAVACPAATYRQVTRRRTFRSCRLVLLVVKAASAVGLSDQIRFPALARLTTAMLDVVLHPRRGGIMSGCEIALLMRFRRRHS